MNAKYYYTQRLMLRLIIFPDKKIKKMDYKALCINSKVFIDKECSDIFYEIVLFLSKKKKSYAYCYYSILIYNCTWFSCFNIWLKCSLLHILFYHYLQGLYFAISSISSQSLVWLNKKYWGVNAQRLWNYVNIININENWIIFVESMEFSYSITHIMHKLCI